MDNPSPREPRDRRPLAAIVKLGRCPRGELEAGRRLPAAQANPAAVVLSSPWRIDWRRSLRDRVAVASGIFLMLLVLAVFPGAKLVSVALGHGPDDLYPYAAGHPLDRLLVVLRRALLADDPSEDAVVTMLAMDIGTAVGICVYVEAVFRMPGLGFTTIQSMGGAGHDLPMLVGITVFTGRMIIVLNLLVDLFAVAVDPTIGRSPRAGRGAFGLSPRAT